MAAVLGDMPLAVAAAGALLASTDMSVAEYLRQLEQQPTLTLPEGHPLARLLVGGREGLEPFPRPAGAEVRGRRPAAGDLLGDGAGHQP